MPPRRAASVEARTPLPCPLRPKRYGARWSGATRTTCRSRRAGEGPGTRAGAVPDGGLVLSLERMRGVRSFEPLMWRGEFEAGMTTADVRRRARENGLWLPLDPGAVEQSHIGGNVATN